MPLRHARRREVTADHHAIVCGWCGCLVMEGLAPPSTGMCVACLDQKHPARVAAQAVAVVALIPVLLVLLAAVFP